jgi:uncharacterized protein (TIGR03067 family)
MRLLALILGTCLLVGCGATHAANPAQETANWQGTWKMVSCIANGQTEPGDVQWIVDGDHYTISVDGQNHVDPYNFTLDPSKKQIDVFHHDTPKGTYGGSLKGIYELEGDSLKVCYDLTGQKYPKSFDASRSSRQVIYEFRRERK